MAKKGGLGRGLTTLFQQSESQDVGALPVRLSAIEPNAGQPRRDFSPELLDELAESIRRYGVLQPLTVRPLPGGRYQLVAGERRWRAARLAGLTEVPAVVRELTDQQAAEIALVENLQREDLNPVEEAAGYRSLMEEFGLTQDEVAARVGRSRPAVANAVRLLGLPEPILELLKSGKISAGHGRALLAFHDEAQQQKAAQAASYGANVREIERMAKRAAEGPKETPPPRMQPKPDFYRQVELSLAEQLGRRVTVRPRSGKNGKEAKGGRLEIEFYNADDLQALALHFE